MTTLAERVEEARAKGFTDEAIRSRITLTPEFAQAKSKGFDDEQIFSHLGFAKAGTSPAAASAPAGGPPPPAKPPADAGGPDNALVSNPLVRYPAMVGSGVAKGLSASLDALAGGAAAIERGGQAIGVPNALLPHTNSMQRDWQAKHPGQEVPSFTAAGREAGVIDNPGLVQDAQGFESNSRAERFLRAGAEGVGAAIPTLALPGSKAVAMGSGLAGGEGAQAANELFPNSKVAPIVGGLIGGTAVQAARGLFARNEVLKAAAKLGTSETPQEAGQVAQNLARDWMETKLPNKLGSIWTPVDSAMTAQPVALTNFESTLNSMTTKAGALQGVGEAVSGAAPKRILKEFNNSLAALQGNATWDDVKAFRTMLGDAKANPKLLKDLSAQQIDGLYAAVTKDMEGAAAAVSPTTKDLFQAANKESTRLYQFAEKTLGQIIKGASENSKDKVPEAVATALLQSGRKGGSTLTELRKEVPEIADELAAASLRMPASQWAKLAPEAKEALVADPRLRSRIEMAISTPTAKEAGLTTLAAIFGNEYSAAVAHWFNKELGGGNELVSPESAKLIGGLAPFVASGAGRVARNPLMLQGPATGALVGSEITRK